MAVLFAPLGSITVTDNVDSGSRALMLHNDFNIELILDGSGDADAQIIDVDEAAKLNPVDKIILEGDDIDLAIEAGAFAPANQDTKLNALSAIETDGTGSTVTITDDGDTAGSTIDLNQISSTAGISEFTVNGDTGANIIQLSEHLSTSGTTTVDLGADGGGDPDTTGDEVVFNLSDASFESSTFNGWTSVENFNADDDKFGVFYGSNSMLEGGARRLTKTGGPQSVTADLTFIEDDVNTDTKSNLSSINAIKSAVAVGVSSKSDVVDRLTTVTYAYDSESLDAFVIASDVSGSSSDDLVSSEVNSIVSVARIVGQTDGGLDAPFTNTLQTKDETLS